MNLESTLGCLHYTTEGSSASLDGADYRAIGGAFVAEPAAAPPASSSSDSLAAHRTFIRHDATAVAKKLLLL